MKKFRKFMLHNGDMIGALYFGTPIILMLILPLLIGLIANSEELCGCLIITGMILSLLLIPVLNKIADKYIIGE